MSLGGFIKYITTLIVVILAIYGAFKGVASALLALTVLVLYAALVIFWDKIEFWLEKRGWERFNWFESLATGGVKEAQIYRELKAYEKLVLEYKYQATHDRNYDLDRRSPVFRVIGFLQKRGEGEDTVANVRGLQLTTKNCPDIAYKNFTGENVAVEFSPFSKYCWDVYNVVDLMKRWYMLTSTKIFADIKAGRKTVEARAPFGSHNLDEIKDGDFITFTDASTGARVQTQVSKVKHYKTIEEIAKAEGLQNIMPEAKDISDLVNLLGSIPEYPARIKKGGIYAIRIRPLNN